MTETRDEGPQPNVDRRGRRLLLHACVGMIDLQLLIATGACILPGKPRNGGAVITPFGWESRRPWALAAGALSLQSEAPVRHARGRPVGLSARCRKRQELQGRPGSGTGVPGLMTGKEPAAAADVADLRGQDAR